MASVKRGRVCTLHDRTSGAVNVDDRRYFGRDDLSISLEMYLAATAATQLPRSNGCY